MSLGLLPIVGLLAGTPAPAPADSGPPSLAASATGSPSSYFGVSFGSTIAEGSAPFGGGFAFRLFGGTALARRISLELAASYVDYHQRGPNVAAGGIVSVSAEARFALPLADWLRFTGRGGAHYSFGFIQIGAAEARDRARGAGIVFGGGLLVRVWRHPRTGDEICVGAELSSLWIFQTAVPDGGPTVLNALTLPIRAAW